jgi:TRAP transporter TAXI family solute receptor
MNAADPALRSSRATPRAPTKTSRCWNPTSSTSRWWPGEPSYEAFMGIGRAATKLKILTAMYSSPGMFVVRADSPYKTIRDLVGQPVAFGAKGSGLPILSRYMLDGIGLKQDEDFKSIYLDRAGDGPAMVQDGRAAALWGAGIGWPGFASDGAGAGRRTVHRARRRRDRAHPRQAYIPETADGALPTAIRTSRRDRFRRLLEFVLVRESLPDDVAYRLARTLHGAGSRVVARSCRRPARPRLRTQLRPRRMRR